MEPGPGDSAPKNKEKDDDKDTGAKETTTEEKLDFYSEKFDPLLALKCKSARPPVPGAKTFDNLAMFNSYLKRMQQGGATANQPQRDVFKKPKPGSSKEQQVDQFQRRFQPHQSK